MRRECLTRRRRATRATVRAGMSQVEIDRIVANYKSKRRNLKKAILKAKNKHSTSCKRRYPLIYGDVDTRLSLEGLSHKPIEDLVIANILKFAETLFPGAEKTNSSTEEARGEEDPLKIGTSFTLV